MFLKMGKKWIQKNKYTIVNEEVFELIYNIRKRSVFIYSLKHCIEPNKIA